MPVTAEPLPRVPGPKLAAFTPTARADIEFIEELGDPANNADAFVWKVRINGKEPCYALKMFFFNSDLYLQNTVGGYITRPLASPQLWIDYFDPFNCECRAYGRLDEELRDDLAISAHGYLLLTPEQEVEVIKRSSPIHPDSSDHERDDYDPFGREDVPHGGPVHAIVKHLATNDIPFGPDQVRNLWTDLEELHKIGILVRDITIENYIGGKLIDFSRAWTVPHPAFQYIYPSSLREQRQRDPRRLQNAIADWGMAADWDWETVDMPKELKDCALGKGENDGVGTDPRLYDWRKWESEEDLEAIDAFFEHGLYASATELQGTEEQ